MNYTQKKAYCVEIEEAGETKDIFVLDGSPIKVYKKDGNVIDGSYYGIKYDEVHDKTCLTYDIVVDTKFNDSGEIEFETINNFLIDMNEVENINFENSVNLENDEHFENLSELVGYTNNLPGGSEKVIILKTLHCAKRALENRLENAKSGIEIILNGGN
ncbi:TPA: hypothetical protein U4W96_000186 [Streptococcus agalactiae]|uniref:hypothetical protein n=1 Tax=Streptococcus agalactiae TaxID=1311 RepID=UPI000D6EF22A|nr:hypothetical protein [Streptococcus agalactiae]PWT25380.1 hypothetical protein CUZ34_01245 [Streptococcus agalactiae]HEN3143884.1 hypothetical protein [Streptococcus agalactiae]